MRYIGAITILKDPVHKAGHKSGRARGRAGYTMMNSVYKYAVHRTRGGTLNVKIEDALVWRMRGRKAEARKIQV